MNSTTKHIIRLGGLALVAAGLLSNVSQVSAIVMVGAGLAAFFFTGGGT